MPGYHPKKITDGWKTKFGSLWPLWTMALFSPEPWFKITNIQVPENEPANTRPQEEK